jgi:phenylacetate-CoA ligase
MADPLLTRMMLDALRDPGDAWTAVGDSLRSALLDHARRSCPYWESAAPPGTPFERIPPLTKAVMRDRWDDLQARGVAEDQRFEGTTSGSMGEPAHYANDRTAVFAHLAGYDALRALAGIPLDAPTIFITTSPTASRTFPPGWITWSAHGLAPEGVPALVETWSSAERYFVQGRSSMLEWIAHQMEIQGLAFDHPPLAVIASQDMMSPGGRERIARAFGCAVHSWYGGQETCGMLATTLEDGERYAFNPLLCHVEVVDDDGLPVRDGDTGRLLVTDLHNRVCPMIRYDTQDIAVWTEERRGAWPMIARLEGRSGELLHLPSGRTVSATALGFWFFAVNDFTSLIALWQCLQTAHDTLELRVVWRRPPTPAEVAQIEDAVKGAAGPDTLVRVVGVEELDTLPSGKRWIIRRSPDVEPTPSAAAWPSARPGRRA